MEARPNKRRRVEKSAALDRTFEYNNAYASHDEPTHSRPKTSSDTGKALGVPGEHTVKIGKSFMEQAQEEGFDTQPIETQEYNGYVFDPETAASRKRSEANRRGLTEEVLLDEADIDSPDSDEDLANMVTDPAEHPLALENNVFHRPQTPVINNKGRKGSGNTRSESKTSVTRTPASIALGFGNGLALHGGLTQMWEHTQADDSPSHAVKSDDVWNNRPSPNFDPRDPTPRKFFTSSPPRLKRDVSTQDIGYQPGISKAGPLDDGLKPRSSVVNSLTDMASSPRGFCIPRSGDALSNPLLVRDAESDMSDDELAPVTISKARQVPELLSQLSVEREIMEHSKLVSTNHANTYVQRTPEGSPIGRKPKGKGTQNSDRVTDSQCSPQRPQRAMSQPKSFNLQAQKSQSVYSHLDTSQLGVFGENTQAFIRDSSPQGPPSLKTNGSDSQDQVQSSPPIPVEVPANSMSQKTSSIKVAIVNPEEYGDAAIGEEVETLDIHEQHESMIDLGIGELSATQITSPSLQSEQQSLDLNPNIAIARSVEQAEAPVKTDDNVSAGERGEEEVIGGGKLGEKEQASDQGDTEGHEDEDMVDEVAALGYRAASIIHPKLSDIAAELSQPMPEYDMSLSQDRTTGEQGYHDFMKSQLMSGSSPIAPRRLKRANAGMTPNVESNMPIEATVQQQPRPDLSSNNSMISSRFATAGGDTACAVERSSSPELELGVEVSRYQRPVAKSVQANSTMSKSGLVRPTRFLNERARRLAAAQQKAGNKARSVYDVEESQFEVQSTASGDYSQNVMQSAIGSQKYETGVHNPTDDMAGAAPISDLGFVEKNKENQPSVKASRLIEDVNPQQEEQVRSATIGHTPNVIENPGHDSLDEEIFTQRIFAYCGGQYNACFTATCQEVLQARGSLTRLVVAFDDGSTAIIDADKWVYRLILKAGDLVRVDLPNFKKKNYVVHGLKDKLVNGTNQASVLMNANGFPVPTDIYGHQTVRVGLRIRESMSSTAATSSVLAQELMDVPIKAIRILPAEFSKFESRKFQPDEPGFAVKISTAPLSTIESSRSTPLPTRGLRRSIAASFAPPSLERANSASSTISRVSLVKPPRSSVFANMAFAISMSSTADQKRKDITQIVVQNDGQIFDDGFETIFKALNVIPKADKKMRDASTSAAADSFRDALQVSAAYVGIGFTALISDSHARRPKHMQALALNLPILHYRWVEDSVKAEKALSWHRYLLPAGESSFLDGAIRSRSLLPYDPISENARLEIVVRRRILFFNDKSILFVTGRKTEPKRKLFRFLASAMGPRALLAVSDLTEARKAMIRQKWDWVFVESEEQVKAAQKLFVNEDCWVVDDEYLVQSLILGELAE